MLYVLAVIAGIIAAAVGWFITAAVGAWVAGLCGMSDCEGGRGMFAAFVVGPVGGLIAMVAATWLVFRIGEGRTALAPTLQRVGLVLAAIVAVVAAATWIRLATSTRTATPFRPRLNSRSVFRSPWCRQTAPPRASNCTPTGTSATACSQGIGATTAADTT